MFVFNGKEIETDSHGYLKIAMNEDMVPILAELEEIDNRTAPGNYPFCSTVLFGI